MLLSDKENLDNFHSTFSTVVCSATHHYFEFLWRKSYYIDTKLTHSWQCPSSRESGEDEKSGIWSVKRIPRLEALLRNAWNWNEMWPMWRPESETSLMRQWHWSSLHNVGRTNKTDVQDGHDGSLPYLICLHFLEVKFRKLVHPIRNLKIAEHMLPSSAKQETWYGVNR